MKEREEAALDDLLSCWFQNIFHLGITIPTIAPKNSVLIRIFCKSLSSAGILLVREKYLALVVKSLRPTEKSGKDSHKVCNDVWNCCQLHIHAGYPEFHISICLFFKDVPFLCFSTQNSLPQIVSCWAFLSYSWPNSAEPFLCWALPWIRWLH